MSLKKHIKIGGLREGVFLFSLSFFAAIRRPFYAPCVLWCAPFDVFIQFALTYKKEAYKNNLLNLNLFLFSFTFLFLLLFLSIFFPSNFSRTKHSLKD